MKKRVIIFSVLLLAFLFVVRMGMPFRKDVAMADEGTVFELNTQCENLSDEFWENQREAKAITDRFYEYLIETYGATYDASVYAVNGTLAENFPPYFAGTYINTQGQLIVQIVETYYTANYRECDWYREFTEIVGSENFYCHPVRYSYEELINAISEVTLGDFAVNFRQQNITILDAEIDEYGNRVVVHFHNQEEYDAVIGYLDSGIYSVSVATYNPVFDVGVYPGEGATKYSTGGNLFSLACRVRRNEPGGTVVYGFLTCAHAFSGNSSVYMNTGTGSNSLIGTTYSFNQVYGGNADVAFIALNANASPYNTVYLYPYWLNPQFPGSAGSVAYKMGRNGLTYETIISISYSTIDSNGIPLNQLISSYYYAAGGDSGGIVFTSPNANNEADILGIHSGHMKMEDGTFVFSFCTKIQNDLAALQSGPITYTLY